MVRNGFRPSYVACPCLVAWVGLAKFLSEDSEGINVLEAATNLPGWETAGPPRARGWGRCALGADARQFSGGVLGVGGVEVLGSWGFTLKSQKKERLALLFPWPLEVWGNIG